jgi:hypothetical protein
MRIRLFAEVEIDDVAIASEIRRIKADHPSEIVINDLHVADSVSRQVELSLQRLPAVREAKVIFIPKLLKAGL